MSANLAVITGFAKGLSEQLADKLLQAGYLVVGLSRSGKEAREFEKHHDRFIARTCDIGDNSAVAHILTTLREDYGDATLLIHNAAQLYLDDFLEIKPEEFEQSWRTACFGAFNVTRQILPAMLSAGRGTLIYTGATASVKAGAQSAAFAASKFALRGFAQSLARAYGARGIHVIHTIIDGVIWGQRAEHKFQMSVDDCMQAEEIADTYMALIAQKSSSWSHEIDLRPYKESF